MLRQRDSYLRICQFILAAITLGTNGTILGQYGQAKAFVMTEVVAGIAVIASITRLVVSKEKVFGTFAYDLCHFAAWVAAVVYLANELRAIDNCGFDAYTVYNFPRDGRCDLVKCTVACAFASTFAWFASSVIGILWCAFGRS